MVWQVPKIWEDGECFILGGGRSVAREFGIPDDTVEKVLTGQLPFETYVSAFSELEIRQVIGINVAYKLGARIVDIVFFGDSNFYGNHRKGLFQFKGTRVTCSEVGDPWIKFLKKDSRIYGISKNPETVCWNANSGAAAISLAAHLGVKRINLLGFDMNLTEGRQHFHSEYGNKIHASVFPKHLAGFPQIARDAKERGIEILNVSPQSAIKEFPKVKLSEVL